MIHNIFALGRFGHHSINLLAVPDFLRRVVLDFAPVFDLSKFSLIWYTSLLLVNQVVFMF